MPWTLNPAIVGNHILKSTFSDPGGVVGYMVSTCAAFGGVMPSSPTITTGTTLLANQVSISGVFYAPSDGVVRLSTPIRFSNPADGTLSFIRLYTSNGIALADISCSLVATDNSAVASNLTLQTGVPFEIVDIRMKINTSGNTSVNPPVAHDFLYKMIGLTPNYGYISYFFVSDSNTSMTLELYTGTIPSRADSSPTGTKLWTYTSPINAYLFSQNNLSLGLNIVPLAVATASGIPTYCRIRKAAFGTRPEAIIQVPVTTDGSGCTLSASSFTSGQSYSITGLTLALQ